MLNFSHTKFFGIHEYQIFQLFYEYGLILDYPIAMSMKQIDEIAEKLFEVMPNTNSKDYEVENTTVSESKRSKTVWKYTYMKFESYRAWIRSSEQNIYTWPNVVIQTLEQAWKYSSDGR